MTTQGVLVESVFSGLTGEVGDFVNKRLSGGRVAFHPSGGGNTYKNVYASATVSGSTLLDQSVNQGILLDGSGSAEVYAVGHYLCKAYDSNGVLQRTFDLRIGSVTSDSSGDSAVSTSTLNIKTSYGTNASDINDAITYANANSANSFVFLFEDANFTVENNMIFPSNVTIQVEPTAKLMIYAGVNSVTINGAIKHDFNQIFKYENNTTCTITIDPEFTEQIYPQWFGAVPDGTSDSSFLVTKALATGIKRLVLSGGNFKLNSNITIPSDVEIIRKGGADFTLASGVTITGLGTKATVFDKVGIGTSSPGSIIEVYGSNESIINNNAVTNNNHSYLLKEQGVTVAGIVKYGSTHLSQANNLALKNYANGSLIFQTNSTERMRISSNGNVAIGTSSPINTPNFSTVTINNGVWGGQIQFSSAGGYIGDRNSGNTGLGYYANSGQGHHFCVNGSSADVMVINSSGKVFMPSLGTSGSGTNVIINPSTGELYEETSSLKFKEKVEDIKIDTSKIYDIQPRTYIRKESDIEEIGFIAEEVNELIPEVVSFKNDAPYSINYAKLVVPIITEMKKLKAEIKELKEKISALEKK